MKVAGVIARPVISSTLLVLLGESRPFAVLFALIVLLAILDEPALPLTRCSLALALDDVLRRLRGWRFVKLLYEALVRAWPVLSFGVH